MNQELLEMNMESKKEKDAFLKISRILSTLNVYQANSVLNNIN
ncbi:primosomal protein, partial [Vibrio cholerae]|nr:primosomal protein [Vibrio cholerae]